MLSHYKYEISSGTDYAYSFTTSKGISYRIAFTEDHNLTQLTGKEIQNVYSLSLVRGECLRPGEDPLIKGTIDKIVSDFFENRDKCVLFLCDDMDNKAKARYKTFCKWHRESINAQYIEKYDNVIPEDNKYVYTSILFHREFPDRENILSVFKEIELLYKDLKNSA